jgi:acyl carrier protein
MDRVRALNELSAILGEVLDRPSLALTEATSAADIEGWDSMTNISFVVEVERRFSIKFKTAEVEEMHNAGDMLDMIAAKRAG